LQIHQQAWGLQAHQNLRSSGRWSVRRPLIDIDTGRAPTVNSADSCCVAAGSPVVMHQVKMPAKPDPCIT